MNDNAPRSDEVTAPDIPQVVTSKDYTQQLLHLLQVYPILSPSHVHQVLGPSVRVVAWKPFLYKLIQEGVIMHTAVACMSPSGRMQSRSLLCLASNKDILDMVIARLRQTSAVSVQATGDANGLESESEFAS